MRWLLVAVAFAALSPGACRAASELEALSVQIARSAVLAWRPHTDPGDIQPVRVTIQHQGDIAHAQVVMQWPCGLLPRSRAEAKVTMSLVNRADLRRLYDLDYIDNRPRCHYRFPGPELVDAWNSEFARNDPLGPAREIGQPLDLPPSLPCPEGSAWPEPALMPLDVGSVPAAKPAAGDHRKLTDLSGQQATPRHGSEVSSTAARTQDSSTRNTEPRSPAPLAPTPLSSSVNRRPDATDWFDRGMRAPPHHGVDSDHVEPVAIQQAGFEVPRPLPISSRNSVSPSAASPPDATRDPVAAAWTFPDTASPFRGAP